MPIATPESRLTYLEDLIHKMRQELEKQGRLIEILNEALRKHNVIESVCHCTTPIGSTAPDRCGKCGKKIGWQTVL